TPWFERSGIEARDETLRRSLDAALDLLTARLGEDMAAWQWGDIHHVRFVGQLAMIPDIAELFTGGIAPIGGNEQTVLASLYEPGGGRFDAVIVPSWRQILDSSDWDASVGTHTVGQSGHPASEHFNDLFELWSIGRYHPLPYSRAAVEAGSTSTMTLAP
ncbi:MAG TPA: penicillin acylase family protein, partial [Actinobacteria bacterium]|nr:penicillin acylase family protein [Actinomycetota bacterium]